MDLRDKPGTVNVNNFHYRHLYKHLWHKTKTRKALWQSGFYGFFFGATDGARTHDNRNHNPGLYQLSYSRR